MPSLPKAGPGALPTPLQAYMVGTATGKGLRSHRPLFIQPPTPSPIRGLSPACQPSGFFFLVSGTSVHPDLGVLQTHPTMQLIQNVCLISCLLGGLGQVTSASKPQFTHLQLP